MPSDYPQRRQNLVYGGKSGFVGYLMIRPPGPWRMYWKTLAGSVLWMDFNQCQAIDLSGHENNGTIYGAQCVPGRSGKALSFDGVDDYVKVPNSESLNITDAITIVAWVYPTNLDEGFHVIAQKRAGAGRGYALWFYSNDLSFGVETASGWQYACVAGIGELNKWQHAAGTFNSATGELVICKDGVCYEFSKTAEKIIPGTDNLYVGSNDGATYFFNGLIDEVRIYNRALSEEEIKWLYEHT